MVILFQFMISSKFYIGENIQKYFLNHYFPPKKHFSIFPNKDLVLFQVVTFLLLVFSSQYISSCSKIIIINLKRQFIGKVQGLRQRKGQGGHGPPSFCLSNISVFGIFTNTALGTTVPQLISY